ncbi:MAG: ABC transporter permease [Candidatus Wallbacteria bacterium]|nr:ABC transporter permease [Candidatus Wallbacteria bacterium]
MQTEATTRSGLMAAELVPLSAPAFWQETRALTRRWVLQAARERMMIVFGLMQPLLWLLLFGNVFSGVARWRPDVFGTDNYLAFQTAGILALTVLGNAMMGGVPLLFDRESGMLAKILVTPSWRGSLVASRFLFTSAFSLAQALLILLVAFLMGVRIASGFPGFLVILWISLLLSIGFTVLSLMLAFLFPHHGAFFAVTGFITQPLLFLSTALMPRQVMPHPMQYVVWANPLTYATEVARDAMLRTSPDGWLLLQASAILILFDALVFWKATGVIRRRLE